MNLELSVKRYAVEESTLNRLEFANAGSDLDVIEDPVKERVEGFAKKLRAQENQVTSGWELFKLSGRMPAAAADAANGRQRSRFRPYQSPTFRLHKPVRPTELTFQAETVACVREGLFLARQMEGFEEPSVEEMIAVHLNSGLIAANLGENFRLTMLGFARSLIQRNVSSFRLSAQRSFVNAFDAALQSNILVVPKQFATFSNLLCTDLMVFLQAGGSVVASWGSLQIIGDNVIMQLVASRSELPPQGLRPISLE